MLAHLRRLSGQTLVYGLGDAATRLVAILLLPLYTHILTPEDYGRLAITALFSTILGLLLEAGQRTAFFRFYFQAEGRETRRTLTGTLYIYLCISAAIAILALELVFGAVAPVLVKDETLVPLIRIALVGVFFDVGSILPFSIFRAEQRATQYAILSCLRFVISALLNILAVAVLRWGVVGVIYANLLTGLLFFFVCSALTFRAMTWTVDLPWLKRLLAFGLPLVLMNLASWSLTLSDRFFLERYTDLSQVGIYSLGYAIAGLANMVMAWFNTAWGAYVFAVAERPEAKLLYSRVLSYSMFLFTLMGLGLSLFAPQALVLFTTPAYYGAGRVVFLIVVSYLLSEVYYFSGIAFSLSGKTGYASLVAVIAAVANLALNFVLIPGYGIMGAAVATVLSYALLPLLALPLAQRIYPVPYEWIRLAKLAVVTGAVYLVSLIVKTDRFSVDLFVGVGLILAWGFALFVLRYFADSELAAAKAAARTGFGLVQARVKSLAGPKQHAEVK